MIQYFSFSSVAFRGHVAADMPLRASKSRFVMQSKDGKKRTMLKAAFDVNTIVSPAVPAASPRRARV